MAAEGMYDTEHQCPTYAAVVLFGYKPRRFMPGLYVQYVRFKGVDVTSEVENEMQLEGNYCELLPRLESLLELSVIKKKPVFVSILREEMVSNYPYQAIRELLLNATRHSRLRWKSPRAMSRIMTVMLAEKMAVLSQTCHKPCYKLKKRLQA